MLRGSVLLGEAGRAAIEDHAETRGTSIERTSKDRRDRSSVAFITAMRIERGLQRGCTGDLAIGNEHYHGQLAIQHRHIWGREKERERDGLTVDSGYTVRGRVLQGPVYVWFGLS